MGLDNEIGVDFCFRLVHATSGFESTNYQSFSGSDKPVSGWHRGAIIKKRSILNNYWVAIKIAYDNFKIALRRSTEKLGDTFPICWCC